MDIQIKWFFIVFVIILIVESFLTYARRFGNYKDNTINNKNNKKIIKNNNKNNRK